MTADDPTCDVPQTQQKHPDSPLWHPSVPLQGFSWRCFLGVHHWRKWSAMYRASVVSKGEVIEGVKRQERYCDHCNKRQVRNAT
jgi:hypothetical protein